MTKFEIEEKIVAMLKTVFDPEIPVNVYDLGLIYKIDVADSGEATIDMTLTAPNCPAADFITEIIVIISSYLRISTAGTNSRNFTVFYDITCRHRQRRTIRTYDNAYFIFFDKAGCNRSSFSFIRFVISYNKLDLFA